MTVILGINLTDRVYIAADTRVSKILDGEVLPLHDNMMKIANIEGIVIACAGDAGLAAHILRSIRSEKLADHGIDHFKQNIASWIAPMCEGYWSTTGHTTYATLICGGRSKQRKKWVDRKKFNDMLNAFYTDPELNGNVALLRDGLAEGLLSQSSNKVKTSYYDTLLFSVSVSHLGITLTDTEWGQHLIFGSPGLVKEDVALSHIARLEFGKGERQGTHAMLLTAYLYSITKERNLEGVGSTVVPVGIEANGLVGIQAGGVHVIEDPDEKMPTVKTISHIDSIGGKLHRIEKEGKYPLQFIEEYNPQDFDKLIL